MADVFDIDSGSRMDYHNQHNEIDSYGHRGHGGWTSVDTSSRKDPRLANRRDVRINTNIEQSSMQLYDKLGVPISPVRKHYSRSPSPKRRHRRSPEHSSLSPHRKSADRDGWHSPQRLQKQQQMYSQPPLPHQSYQQPPLPPVYQHEQYSTTGYSSSASSYQQGYGQVYGQPPTTTGYNQYSSPAGYPQQPQGYNSGHQQPGPPGDEYPGAWAPVTTSYPNMCQPPPPVARPSPAPPSSTLTDAKKDNLKKEAAIANEMKQQQATLIKQRDEYLRKASVLRRELDKLRLQKHELLTEKSPPRDSQRILRENAKLQLEIQNKLKSINNVVDMLSGIIGDGLQMKDDDGKTTSSTSPKRLKEHSSRTSSIEEDEQQKRSLENYDTDVSYFNYIHYDPELHWCRVCDVFPRSAKDFLNHLHSAEHRQVTQEHQLVDTPWHKLPTDEELPSYKGAPVKRIPIKGLQFFISATAWYCKLCDAWIGDLHCASLHLKSKNHSHNYSNFVEQNPHWETNWLKDREKAFERCGKLKLQSDEEGLPPAPEPPLINDKRKNKKRKEKHDSFLDISKEKKRKKKSKKRKKIESSGSSSSSSSSESSSEEDSDRSKSIRVAMRNKMRMQAQLILKEEMEGKLEALGRLVEEDRRKKETEDTQQESNIEDNIINQWMTVNNQTSTDKHILEGLKGRLKQRQEADKEKAEQAAAEQRKREREREERELKEMREREQKEMEEKVREEQEKEERDREERERIKEKERSRRRHRSDSASPERYRGRSRSRSVDRRSSRSHNKLQERQYRRSDKRSDRHSPESDKYKPKRYEEERNVYESHFEKQTAELAKSNKEKKSASSSSSRKLPFIGRMPLFKKKGDGEEKEIKKEDYDIRQSKFEPVSSARAFIPAPGVVHITKLATPPDPMQMIKINAENPPPPPKIIPEPPQISKVEEVAPPPPIITPIITEPPVDSHELEMEDVQAPPLPPGVPVAEAKPLAKPAGNHLPRDFQEALNIIFPGDQRPDQMAMAQDPNLMMQYQYGMGYGMMYPGMQMYDYSAAQDPMAGSEETIDALHAENRPEEIHPGNNDDDLAMLGIDAEDMAAQTI